MSRRKVVATWLRHPFLIQCKKCRLPNKMSQSIAFSTNGFSRDGDQVSGVTAAGTQEIEIDRPTIKFFSIVRFTNEINCTPLHLFAMRSHKYCCFPLLKKWPPQCRRTSSTASSAGSAKRTAVCSQNFLNIRGIGADGIGVLVGRFSGSPAVTGHREDHGCPAGYSSPIRRHFVVRF